MATSAGNPLSSSDDTLPGSGLSGSTVEPLSSSTKPAVGSMGAGGTAGAGGAAQSDLLARVVQGAHQTVDRLAETVAPHVQRMQESVGSAGDLLQSRRGDLREMSDEWADNVRDTVRENPLAAVAAAVAVGIVLAKLSS
ncbi:MAG: hypothetical protein RL227_1256 [Pseudomonadota bacterium]